MKKNIFLFMCLMAVSVVTPVLAQQSYDIKEMTPEVKAALDGRRGRYEQLTALKAQGALGESNRGYVEVLKGDGQVEGLADAENRDRKFIYQTIVEQNGLPSEALFTVEKVFAQVQREKAVSGDKVQLEDGSWIVK